MSEGRRILVTAGPTHEPIDAVRYLANRSSGRMGICIAEAAASAGWTVSLLLGPTAAPAPPERYGLSTSRFQTTEDLRALLRRLWPDHDVLVMAAAVADYRPRRSETGQKIRRGEGKLALELEPTPDLLAEASAVSRPDQLLIGFALEPQERLERSARDKLARKGVHAIVANPLETMGAEDVHAQVFLADGRVLRPDGRLSKADFAAWLIRQIDPIDEMARDRDRGVV